MSALNGTTSHYDHWLNWTSEYPTTKRYKLAGWLSIMSTVLQRRVWIGSFDKAVFANQFLFLVSPPGVGKSCVTADVRRFVSFHKRKLAGSTDANIRLQFPITADSTSFEAIVRWISKTGLCSHRKPDGKYYTYHSGCLILDELMSIFHKDAQNMATFLLSGWNCQEEYIRETIGRGEDKIENLCVNIIGGTQPDKLVSANRDDLIGNGFIRRAVIIYDDDRSNRKTHIPAPTVEQEHSRDLILAHILKLSTLYGQVKLTPAAHEYVEHGWIRGGWRRNNPAKVLDYFFESLIEHIHKVAMCVHFADSTSMDIGVESYQRAYEILSDFTLHMHKAFSVNSMQRDLLADTILNRVATAGEIALKDLYVDYASKVEYRQFVGLLDDLTIAGRLKKSVFNKYSLK